MNKILSFLTLICIATVLVSCEKDLPEQFDHYAQFKLDSLLIEDYMSENSIDAFNVMYNDQATGIYMQITENGTVDTISHPEDDSVIKIAYKGYLTNGDTFDRTVEGDSYTGLLNGFITGWRIAFPQLTKGDKATIIIPSYYGYQNSSSGPIPANSILIFDVELIDFL